MTRLKIKNPIDQDPAAGSARKGRGNFIFLALFFLAVLVILAGSLWLFFSPKAAVSYPFELGRFSGKAEIYSYATKKWTTVTRRQYRQIVLRHRDRIKTESDSDLDFRIPGVFNFRLKPSSEIEFLKSRKPGEIKAKLNTGALLGQTGEEVGNHKLELETERINAAIREAYFLIQTGKEGTTVSSLKGEVLVGQPKAKKMVPVKMLETVTKTDEQADIPKPNRMNYQEWRTLSEVRDLTSVTAEQIAEQLDLRKKAGNFFKYVFDEGVFFKPNWGYAEREFYEDPELKQVIFRLDYDVFPQSSFSGMYFKTRDLDLSKKRHISLNVKADASKPVPDQFRIELKDHMSTVRGFAIKGITTNWNNYSFELTAAKPTPVDEMVFVFENTRVGPLNTNGTVYIKDLIIE